MIRVMYLLLTAALLTHTACGQNQSNDKIPAAVTSAFHNKFPDAKKVHWDIENATEYEAEFKLNGAAYSAAFDLSGKWLETETIIKISALPEAVQFALKNDFGSFKINEAAKIETAQNEIRYEAEIEKGEETFDVLFSADGKKLSRTETEDEESDND